MSTEREERGPSGVERSRASGSPSIATLLAPRSPFQEQRSGVRERKARDTPGARINGTCVANLKPPSPCSFFLQSAPVVSAPPLWDFNNAARYALDRMMIGSKCNTQGSVVVEQSR